MTHSRIAQIQQLLKKQKCPLLALSSKDTTHRWLLDGAVVDNSLIFVASQGKPTIIMSALEHFSSRAWQIITPKTRDEQTTEINKLLAGIKKIAVSGSTCSLRLQETLGSVTKVKFVDVEKELLMLRAVKSSNEMKLLQRANDLTVDCFDALIADWHSFSHERDVIRYIKQFALTHDVGLAFDPIVASGANAAVAHHKLSTKLNRGFCVLDFGFTGGGYHADMTRTIYIGTPSISEILLYNRVLEIQEAAVALVKPGVKCADLHNYVVKMLGEKDAALFIHSLGHGVGLDIHELPNVSSKSEQTLAAGMAITIEPGIYDATGKVKSAIGKFGIRIEDSVIVDKKGHINMTKKATKTLFCMP